MQSCNHSRRILYFGHATFEKTDILQSRLVLSDITSTDSADLTIADVFTMDISANCPRFTIIACGSGSQDSAPSDEPLDFIPALLSAGATSVLGTMWPVESRTARIFSEIFHQKLDEQLKSSDAGPKPRILDLAAALGTTICHLMDRSSTETRQPIH